MKIKKKKLTGGAQIKTDEKQNLTKTNRKTDALFIA